MMTRVNNTEVISPPTMGTLKNGILDFQTAGLISGWMLGREEMDALS